MNDVCNDQDVGTPKYYTYLISKDEQLITKYFRGRFLTTHIIESIHETGLDEQYDFNMDVLYDMREVELDFDIPDIEHFIEYIQSNKRYHGRRKIAFLTQSPNQTVFPVLLRLLSKDASINIQTFSTVSASCKWLGLTPAKTEKVGRCLETMSLKTCQ